MVMLGDSCNQCCNCAVDACDTNGDKLPETVTVTFGQIPSQAKIPQITFDASSCFGGGLVLYATGEAVGTPGPIKKVDVISPGEGYAKLGRQAPVLSVTGRGSGGVFKVMLAEVIDTRPCGAFFQAKADGLIAWEISAAEASGDLSGYTPGEKLTITPESGTVTVEAAELYYEAGQNVRIESPGLYYKENPELPHLPAEIQISVSSQSPGDSGAGAKFKANVDLDPTSATYGSVLSVDVVSGGSNYVAERYRNHLCGRSLPSSTLVLQRTSPLDQFGRPLTSCVWRYEPCVLTFGGAFYDVTFSVVRSAEGVKLPARVAAYGFVTDAYAAQKEANLDYYSQTPIQDCEDFTIHLTSPQGYRATVKSGGNPSQNPRYETGCPRPLSMTINGIQAALGAGEQFASGNGYEISCGSENNSWAIGALTGPPQGPMTYSGLASLTFRCPCAYNSFAEERRFEVFYSPQGAFLYNVGWVAFWFGSTDASSLGVLPLANEMNWSLSSVVIAVTTGNGQLNGGVTLYTPPPGVNYPQISAADQAYLAQLQAAGIQLPEWAFRIPSGPPDVSWSLTES